MYSVRYFIVEASLVPRPIAAMFGGGTRLVEATRLPCSIEVGNPSRLNISPDSLTLEKRQNAAFQCKLPSGGDHRMCPNHHPAKWALSHEEDGGQ